jgi:FkbM family methyltransferase
MTNKKIYIEAGAHDGVFQSRSIQFKNNNEYFGLLIEPHFETYKQCIINRDDGFCKIYNAALVSFDFESTEIQLGIHSEYTAMNSIVKPSNQNYVDTISVPARTLQSILDENNISIVENFYLDTEGYEKNVLNGIDFNKVLFYNIEVECHYPFLDMQLEEEIDMHESFFNNVNYKLSEKILGDGLPKLIFVPNKKNEQS